MTYLHWNETTITDFSEKNVSEMYDRGFVFTRIGKGVMHQTRSVRIDLNKFELNSENKRIMKKVGTLMLEEATIPYTRYDYSIGKQAKDFYEIKFGPGIMSSQKVKEMLTDPNKSNFNLLLKYGTGHNGNPIGYAICYANDSLLHYSYPFYDLKSSPKDMGLAMMIKAIEYAKHTGRTCVYLGSLQRPGDTYKLQFAGLEWFDGGHDGSNKWRTDIAVAKEVLGRTNEK